MEKYLYDLFGTASEEELAEFDDELESIIGSCKNTDRQIISAVQELAEDGGEPVKQPATAVKVRSLLPAVIAAAVALVLFAGLFFKIEHSVRRSAETAPGTESSEQESTVNVTGKEAAEMLKAFFDDYVKAVKEGLVGANTISLRGFAVDLSKTDSFNYRILKNVQKTLQDISRDRGEDNDHPLPENGEFYVYIAPDLVVAMVEWRESSGSEPIYLSDEGMIVDGSGFGGVKLTGCYEGYSSPKATKSSDGIWAAGDLASATAQKNFDLIISNAPNNFTRLNVFDHVNFSTSECSRIKTGICGYADAYPFVEIYVVAETKDGLPFDIEGLGTKIYSGGYDDLISEYSFTDINGGDRISGIIYWNFDRGSSEAIGRILVPVARAESFPGESSAENNEDTASSYDNSEWSIDLNIDPIMKGQLSDQDIYYLSGGRLEFDYTSNSVNDSSQYTVCWNTYSRHENHDIISDKAVTSNEKELLEKMNSFAEYVALRADRLSRNNFKDNSAAGIALNSTAANTEYKACLDNGLALGFKKSEDGVYQAELAAGSTLFTISSDGKQEMLGELYEYVDKYVKENSESAETREVDIPVDEQS